MESGEFSQGIPVNLSDNSPIGYLLPSSKGIGRAALLMIRLLVDAHNSMVLKRKEVQGDQTEIRSVPVQETNVHQLIAFDYDVDLIPMLYAHCSYSFEIGKGTVIDYNFTTLEKQLVTTFIAGKPLIDVAVSNMKFSDEVSGLKLFQKLEGRVEQRPIPFTEQLQMTTQIRCLPDVCNCLRAVKIAIRLLSSTGADPNYFLKKYLEDIRMDPGTFLVSSKMQEVCRLTHIRSTWTMLTVERAHLLHVYRQDPFYLDDIFRVPVGHFNENIMLSIDVEHLLAELTEYIVLEVPLRKKNDVELPLSECLETFLDMKNSSEKSIKGLEHLPDTICLRHIYSFWQVVADSRKRLRKR